MKHFSAPNSLFA